jgi:hypothetical protein
MPILKPRSRPLRKRVPIPVLRLARDVVELVLRDDMTAHELIRLVEVFGYEQLGEGLDLTPTLRSTMSAGSEAKVLNLTATCAEGSFGWRIFKDVAGSVPTARVITLPLNSASRLRLVRMQPALIMEDAFWPAEDAEREEMVRAAAALQVPLAEVLRIVERSPSKRALDALIALWPDEAPAMLIKQFAASPDDQRRRTLADMLSRRFDVLETAAHQGVRLLDRAMDELATAALAGGCVPRPAQDFWFSLRQEAGFQAVPMNLSVILIGSDLLKDGADARRRLSAGFFELDSFLATARLPGPASQYLAETFKALGIYGWSPRSSLAEAYWLAFKDRRGFDPSALQAAQRGWQMDHLLDALRVRWGKSAIAELRRRMEDGGNADWRLGHVIDFLHQHTQRNWWF